MQFDDGLIVTGGPIVGPAYKYAAPKSVSNAIDFSSLSAADIQGVGDWRLGNDGNPAPSDLIGAAAPGRTNYIWNPAPAIGQTIFFDLTPWVKGGCQLAQVILTGEFSSGCWVTKLKGSFGYSRQKCQAAGLGYTILTNDTQGIGNSWHMPTTYSFGSTAIAHGPLYAGSGWVAGPTHYSFGLEFPSDAGFSGLAPKFAIYGVTMVWTSDDIYALMGAANL